jgi:hypothetical protein
MTLFCSIFSETTFALVSFMLMNLTSTMFETCQTIRNPAAAFCLGCRSEAMLEAEQ